MRLVLHHSPLVIVLTAQRLGVLLGGGLLATNLLIGASQNGDWVMKALAFLGVIFLPGYALFLLLRLKLAVMLEKVVYSFGFGILLLMVSGLLANQLFHSFGVADPLALPTMLTFWNIVVVICIVGAMWRWREKVILIKAQYDVPWLTPITIAAAVLLPLLAAGGAFRLNNGGDSLLSCIALGWAAMVIIWLFIMHRRLGDTAIALSIFFIGLSVLLMTSLRSWDITGHDFPHEFRVFTMTHLGAYWDIASFRDPYNACLSITILPEVLTRFLHISGLVVFKFLLQVMFAVTPVVVYLLLRRFVSKLGALVGAILFISYPTFINDSAMLTRQGVAYLFFSLALLAVLHAHRQRIFKTLFLLCAVGVVLSHYSTSYMFVAIFGLALGCKLLLPLFRRRDLQLRGAFSVLSISMFAALSLMTFLWYSQITATSRGLVTTVQNSIQNIPHFLSDDNKSSDTSASLLLGAQHTPSDVYQSYLAESMAPRAVVPPEFEPTLTGDDMPITLLGQQLARLGISPSITNTTRQFIAKLLQLLTVLGVVYAGYRFLRKKPRALSADLVCLGVAGVIVLLSLIILPTLSLNYGILRAFQQALIYLVIPLVLFLATLGHFITKGLKLATATTIMVAFFLLFTGFFAQLLGGVSAPLTLNNYGLYYGLYYTSEAELRGYEWLKRTLPARSDVRAASYAKAIMHDPQYPFRTIGILPSQRPPGSYVFLNQAQLTAQKFYVYHDGTSLITTFPAGYYRQFTSQIYSTATTGVFK
ncbi:MAG TPA: hypothetical protein VFZ58_04405 [Candidatus Saccharimonadales bacterium]